MRSHEVYKTQQTCLVNVHQEIVVNTILTTVTASGVESAIMLLCLKHIAIKQALVHAIAG